MQRYRFNAKTNTWDIDGIFEHVGKIDMPQGPLSAQEIGRRVEGPIRQLIEEVTGMVFKDKLPNAPGADLSPRPVVPKQPGKPGLVPP